jgi:hypothetical protein
MTKTQQVQTTFHDKRTGKQHGPTLLSVGDKAVREIEGRAVRFGPSFPYIAARMIRTERTSVGFSSVSQKTWNTIFRKKGK